MDQLRQLDALVTAVQKSAKYRFVSPDLIRRVGGRELATRHTLKEAVKATKNKLHQVGGAYFEAKIDYEEALARLKATVNDPENFRATCLDLMRRHASTRERLPILDQFYATILAGLPAIRLVVDLACGLNPLTWGWLPLNPQVEFVACDVYADLIHFVGEYMKVAGINGRAQVCDVISQPPVEQADLVLLLKTLPVLEQIEKGAASQLLDRLNARYLLVSFPARSLGGRSKGMAQNYEAQFYAWAKGRDWQIRRFEFSTELAFLVSR